ncbi:MAG: hypothetical protein H0X30_30730 [Anaerolineae bacterium]|nr:hypothetical protein [Anaerolineae bacterium]
MATVRHNAPASSGQSLTGIQLPLSKRLWFLVLWIFANIIGFLIGNALGATNDGLVSHLMSGRILPHIIGDWIFGASFGVAQWLVLRRFFPNSRSSLRWWIPACMIGFMVGARLGARFAPMVGDDTFLVGIAFGALMGISLSTIQCIALWLSGTLKSARPLLWIPVSIVAWIIGESIAFHFGFVLFGVPIEALAIALVSGIALLWWIKSA